jgi:hypothetical protein
MSKKYIIKVELDLKQAEKDAATLSGILAKAEQGGAVESEKAETRKSAAKGKTAKTAEDQDNKNLRTAVRDAAAREALTDKQAKAAQTAATKIQKTLDDQSARNLRSAVRDAATRESLIDKEIAVAESAARAKERAELGPLGRLAQIKRSAHTEEQAQAGAYNRYMDTMHRRRIEQITKEKYGTESSFTEGIRQAIGFHGELTKLSVAMFAAKAAWAMVATTIKDIGAGFQEANEKTREYVNDLIDSTADLRDIAVVEGKIGEEELRRNIALRRASGLTRGEAEEFQKQLAYPLSTIPEATMSAAEKEKLATIEGPRFASMRGGGTGGVGANADLLGMLPMFMPKGTTAKQVGAMGGEIYKILGSGTASQQVMVEQYRKLVTRLTTEDENKGLFTDPRKAAAMAVIASQFDKTAPGEAALEAVRVTEKFTNMRKSKGMSASAAETLKAAGIAPTMDPQQRMEHLFKYVEEGVAKSGGKETFASFMGAHGFREMATNERAQQFYEQFRKGKWGQLMGRAGGPIDPNAATGAWSQWVTRPENEMLINRQMTATAKLEEGQKHKLELNAMERAEQAVVPRDTLGYAGAQRHWAAMYALNTDAKVGRDIEIENEAIRQLQGQSGGKRVSAPWGYNVTHAIDPFNIGLGSGVSHMLGWNERYIKALEENNRLQSEANRLMSGKTTQPATKEPLRQAPKAGAATF